MSEEANRATAEQMTQEPPKPPLSDKKRNALCVLMYVLKDALKLLHPFIPFVTEEIYSYLPHTSGTIMRAPWPKEVPAFNFPEVAQNMDGMMELVQSVFA